MICVVVGARPNFVKMAPVFLELRRRGIEAFLVHTGQHYDREMSEIFFDELSLPKPDIQLSAGSGSHAEQTARIMMAFEPICATRKPKIVLVGGDVNSTLAAALTAAKMSIPVGHVESGLRSFDRSMPEEINRIATDHLAQLLFTTEKSANENLKREGISKNRIYFVGNTMIDSLKRHLSHALKRTPWKSYDLAPNQYGVITLHRPSNIEDPKRWQSICEAIRQISRKLPLVFPVHPRTLPHIQKMERVLALPPIGYLDFLGLMAKARMVLTDSGGIQEETAALGVPCVTLRENTERPITVSHGSNRLAGMNRNKIIKAAQNALAGKIRKTRKIPLWDGKAAVRIVDILEDWLAKT